MLSRAGQASRRSAHGPQPVNSTPCICCVATAVLANCALMPIPDNGLRAPQDLSWDHAAALYEEVLVAAKYQW